MRTLLFGGIDEKNLCKPYLQTRKSVLYYYGMRICTVCGHTGHAPDFTNRLPSFYRKYLF